MEKQTYFLSFEGVSEAEASRYAEELREALLNASTEMKVQRRRENPLAQNWGADLVLGLPSAAVVTAITVIGNWLQKRRVSLKLKAGEREIIADRMKDEDAIKTIQLFLQQSAEEKKPEA